ncbi:MAG: carboxymuconolactone decarboxylase family protein [Anaerolineae bacterium]|nr:carboxymuconolactone decarboxylase family protein [Anaerolineae bacterium]
MMQTTFNKRTFTVGSFSAAIDDMFDHLGDMRAATRQHRISKAFAERVMMAVTQVNGCRYCDFGHARMALKVGVTQAEIDALRLGDLQALPEAEAVAILFAQHYAESRGEPDPAAWEQLVATYGADRAQDIMAYIRMITIGNLYGNTFDALLSRLRGHPARGSSVVQEIGVLLGGLVIVPINAVKHWLRG